MPETKNNIYAWEECAFEMKKKNLYKRSLSFHDNHHHHTIMCAECYALNGEIDLTYFISVNITGKGMDPDTFNALARHTLYSGLIDKTVDVHCPLCGKYTKHIFIDSHIAQHVVLLNKMGIETIFSCEGHGMSVQRGIVDGPYIAFPDSSTKYLWDFTDPRLSTFYQEDFSDGEYAIYLDFEKVSGKDIVEKTYLNPLYDYINQRIPEILKERPIST